MPIYAWECPKCGRVIEMLMNLNAPAPLCCNDDCNCIPMERVISRTNFSLRGDGWAKDSYSKKK